MTSYRVDYDSLAPTYNRRFSKPDGGVGAALLALVQKVQPECLLEVGCGTGHWLAQIGTLVPMCCGLDLSAGMLHQAQRQGAALRLTRGRATCLPFADGLFDLIFCVNALHHFGDPARFIAEAARLLRPGGMLAVVGSGPHGCRDSWYVYDYFAGVYESDLARFPTWEAVRGWMAASGLRDLESGEVEHISSVWQGWEVLADPFLEKHSCSQLALLTEEAYTAGRRRIEAALADAEAKGETPVFRSDISLLMLSGRKPD